MSQRRSRYRKRMNALHVMNAAQKLTPQQAEDIREILQAALEKHARQLEVNGVDVALHITPWGLPETGIYGYAPLGHYVELTVNPDNPNFAACWRTELPATLAHELHHAKRWQGAGYGQTMLEVLVSEGLAQHYEKAERGKPPPYALPPANLPELWQQAAPLLNSTDFGYEAWFFGSEAQNLPRWAGYALGFELVRRYFAVNGGDAVTHAQTPAAAFRQGV